MQQQQPRESLNLAPARNSQLVRLVLHTRLALGRPLQGLWRRGQRKGLVGPATDPAAGRRRGEGQQLEGSSQTALMIAIKRMS